MSDVIKPDFERTPESAFGTLDYEFNGHPFDLIEGVDAIVAGGYMTYLHSKGKFNYNDIDIYFMNLKALDEVCKRLKTTGWARTEDSPTNCENWIRFGSKMVQLISGFCYKDPFHVIDSFDLTCCQIASNGKKVFFHQNAIKDIDDGVINIHRLTNKDRTYQRVIKYGVKGFNPTPETTVKLVGAKVPKQKEKKKKRRPVFEGMAEAAAPAAPPSEPFTIPATMAFPTITFSRPIQRADIVTPRRVVTHPARVTVASTPQPTVTISSPGPITITGTVVSGTVTAPAQPTVVNYHRPDYNFWDSINLDDNDEGHEG